MVSPEKQIWHCFGCSSGGDHFEFIKRIEGVEFPEALRILAKRANVKLEYVNPEWHDQKTRLLDLTKVLAEHWHQLLLNDPEAQRIREYLIKRKVNEQTIKTFQLGYAKDSYDEAIKFLQGQKYSLREIALAGVSAMGERGKPYDRFRHRLMFPIRDIHGNVVGFTGRIMAEDKAVAKYINSPQSVIYNKSQLLYNLDLAKSDIRKNDYAILVEGNMDALAAWQAKTKNVVAVSGTALTTDQVSLLKRFTQNVMIAFDADVAGLTANLRGIDLAWQAGFNVKVVNLPAGTDPDDLIKKDPAEWKEALRKAHNFMDYVFEVTLKDLDLSRVDHKKKAAKKLLTFIAKLGDTVEQSHYLRELAVALDVAEEALAKTLKQQKEEKKIRPQSEEIEEKIHKPNQTQIIAERLLALLVKSPEFLKEVSQRLIPEAIDYLPAQNLYKQLIIHYNKEENLEEKKLLESLDKDSQFYFNQLSLLVDIDSLEDEADEAKAVQYEVIQLVNRLQKNYLQKKLQQIEKDLKVAEQHKDQQKVNLLSKEFSSLIEQLQKL